jgi:hypothetical protein
MPKFNKGDGRIDRRRRHEHWRVTVNYHDKESFSRVYTDRERADKFAVRQKKSPLVKSTRVELVS